MERFTVTDYSDNPSNDRPSGGSEQISPHFTLIIPRAWRPAFKL